MRRYLLGSLVFISLCGPVDAQEGQPRQFVSGELLVGYRNEQDRGNAAQELQNAKDRLKVRGQSLETLEVSPIRKNVLKLRIGFPATVKEEITRTPSAELSFLQGLAEDIKRGDQRVTYAHPNWTVSPPQQTQRSSRSISKQPTRAAKISRKKMKTARRRGTTRKLTAAHRKCRCWQQIVWIPCAGYSRQPSVPSRKSV